MKELRSNLIQFSLMRSRIVPLPVSTDLPQPSVTAIAPPKREHQAIPPLQPPIQSDSAQNIYTQQHLAAQADRINHLAAQLEAAIFELKAIANQIEYSQTPSQNVCEYRTVVVPRVKRHKTSRFILTTKIIDLFQAEREAQQLAQTLRQKTKSKRKPHLLGWLR